MSAAGTINVENFPKSTRLSREAVSKIAEYISEEYLAKSDFDIYKTVDKLGGNVFLKDFWSENSKISGSLFVQDGSDFSIFIPTHTSAQRDRFTIAHELGHYFLHYLYPKTKGEKISKLVANRYGSGRVEWEANWFAASFLMPKGLFSEAFYRYNGNLVDLASEFEVSQSAVIVRAQVLGLTGVKTKADRRPKESTGRA